MARASIGMDWGVQTDNLPAYQEPAQMPSPQRAGRYQPSLQGLTLAPGSERGAPTNIIAGGTTGTLRLPAPPTAPTIPDYPDMPEFEVPDYPDIPEWEAPSEPDYPEFEEPERPSERRYVQEAAAPGIREQRRATRQALASADFARNPIVQATIREQVLRGHGDALSQVMGMAREVGGAKAERIYRGRFEAARTDYQGKMTQARDAYQTSIMKSQADWQTAAQAVRDQWQGGLIASQAEYAARIDERRSEWQGEMQLLRDQYQMDYAKYQAELMIKIDEIMYKLEQERKERERRRGGPQQQGRQPQDRTSKELIGGVTPPRTGPGTEPSYTAILRESIRGTVMGTMGGGPTRPERPGYHPPWRPPGVAR